MSVAASSPVWFTRRADERNSLCSGVNGLSFGFFSDETGGEFEDGLPGLFESETTAASRRAGIVEKPHDGQAFETEMRDEEDEADRVVARRADCMSALDVCGSILNFHIS